MTVFLIKLTITLGALGALAAFTYNMLERYDDEFFMRVLSIASSALYGAAFVCAIGVLWTL